MSITKDITKDFCVFLDAGHGGINPDTGLYTTAPNKQALHDLNIFHNNGWFYEGVSNRTITNKVSEILNSKKIPNVIVSHPYMDTPLTHRTKLANTLSKAYKDSIYISNHSNAFNGSARGFEIFTSPNITRSDKLAKIYYENFEDEFSSEVQMRPGDDKEHHDKEARFTVLTSTVMPAILTEHLFFDNISDAILLLDKRFQNRIAEVQVKSIEQYYNEIIL